MDGVQTRVEAISSEQGNRDWGPLWGVELWNNGILYVLYTEKQGCQHKIGECIRGKRIRYE